MSSCHHEALGAGCTWNLSGLLLSGPDLELNSQPTQSRASPEKGWGQPWTPSSAQAWEWRLLRDKGLQREDHMRDLWGWAHSPCSI